VGQVDFFSKRSAREVLGLWVVLFERQVPALISALWPAQIGATLTFFERFCAHFLAGQTRLDAFHAAQRDLRADPATNHPHLWAPFTLIGADN
jgi:CHAT domain-containing protein